MAILAFKLPDVVSNLLANRHLTSMSRIYFMHSRVDHENVFYNLEVGGCIEFEYMKAFPIYTLLFAFINAMQPLVVCIFVTLCNGFHNKVSYKMTKY